jgi:hypothetical protein
MAIAMDNRTKILAGVVVLLAAAAGAWFFLFQDEAPPPRTVVAPSKSAAPAAKAPAAATAEPAKAADASKTGEAPKAVAEAPKPAAAKPIPAGPDQLIAEVIDASGVKTQFQAISRETLLTAIMGDLKRKNVAPADAKAVDDMVERAFEPGKLGAALAANMRTGFDSERATRFLELLRQPIAVKMNSREMRNATPEAMQEYSDKFRSSPPPGARVKLIQALDEVTRTSETGTELATAIVRNVVDSVLGEMQKAGKSVPKEARQRVGSQLNAMRNQMRSQFRTTLYVAYRNASDQEIAEYVKLLDADTGRWGMQMVATAARPVLVDLGTALGKEGGKLAMSKRGGATAKAPAEPAPEPARAAQPEAPAAAPAAAPAPAEPVGYQRSANLRELYTRYNDLLSATVMRDQAAVKELLDDGKSPNVRQSNGTTPLMIAASNDDVAIASLLLAKGADPNLRAGGNSALSIARSRGAAGAAMVQLLLRSGAKD